MKKFHKKNLILSIGSISLLYALLTVPLTTFIYFEFTPLGVVVFLVETLLPSLAQSFLATYLVLLGGPRASITYRGIITAFMWWSPILPNPPLIISALMNIMIPTTVGILITDEAAPPKLLQRINSAVKPKHRRFKAKKSNDAGWIVVLICCTLIVFASTGLLGFHSTIVGSESMNPILGVGDIALITPVETLSIQVGDIIQYIDTDGILVLHRVVDIQHDDGSELFMTKGDANSVPDTALVFPDQIKGKLALTIPKVGLIPLYLRSMLTPIWANPNYMFSLLILAASFVPSIFYISRVHRRRRRNFLPRFR